MSPKERNNMPFGIEDDRIKHQTLREEFEAFKAEVAPLLAHYQSWKAETDERQAVRDRYTSFHEQMESVSPVPAPTGYVNPADVRQELSADDIERMKTISAEAPKDDTLNEST